MRKTVFSHPPDGDGEAGSPDAGGRLLTTHHEKVATRGREFLGDVVTTGPEGTHVGTLVDVAARVHDLGKAHPEFQAYLLDDADTGPSHAPLGAAAAFHAAVERGVPRTDATIPLVAVARHHQRLPKQSNPYTYLTDEFFDRYLDASETPGEPPRLVEVVDAIEAETPTRQCAETVYADAAGAASWDQFAAALRDGTLRADIDSTIWRGPVPDDAVKTGEYYTALLQTWSTLVLADKTDAAGIAPEEVCPSGTPSRMRTTALGAHVDGLGDETATGRTARLDTLRDAAFREVNGDPLGDDDDGCVHEFINGDAQVATLTLPTGLGKTFTGLGAGFEVREALDDTRTVVYCLPYTSIIDQTATDVQDVFGVSPTSDSFTVHHYLAETVTTLGNDEESRGSDGETPAVGEYSRDERFLGECWQASTVVTTFVQLFESLLGPGNRASAKLPNLTDSVVILDEPQTLPLSDWDIVRDAIAVLMEAYDAHVVLMTATQPRIFAPDDRFEPYQLVDDATQYFQEDTERVAYTFDQSVDDAPVLRHDEAAGRLVADLDSDSALGICNTIPSARTLVERVGEQANSQGYDHVDVNERHDAVLESDAEAETPRELDERYPSVDETCEAVLERASAASNPLVTLHLTSRHRPVDREHLLDVADRLTDHDPPFVFVATQIVEAGVDVSFERAYRDFAPLDSIVQAAGRCNREFELDRGSVTVWHLGPPATDPVGADGTADDAADNGEITPAEAVYSGSRGDEHAGNDLLGVTRYALRETVDFPGTGVPGTAIAHAAVQRYYRRLRDRTEVRPSPVQECATGMLNNYSLIDERCRRNVDVIVARTEQEDEVLNDLRTLFRDRQYETAYEWIDQLSSRTVSVPVYEAGPTPVEQQAIPVDPDGRVQTTWLPDGRSLYDVLEGLTNEESVDDYLL